MKNNLFIACILALGFLLFPCLYARAEVIETLHVNSREFTPVQSSTSLTLNEVYTIEANGTYGGDTQGSPCDAEWVYNSQTSAWQEWGTYQGNDHDFTIMDLLVNDAGQDWLGTSDGLHFWIHTYSPTHVYRIDIVGEGEPMTFKVFDGEEDGPRYWDNNGILEVRILTKPLLLVSPNGGQNIVAGKTYPITWYAQENSPIDYVLIEYSSDNGQNWEDVDIWWNTGSYEWDPIPAVDSNQCLVHISDLFDPNVSDTSNDVFTIFQCRGPIAGDLNGDCYVDFRDFAVFCATWLDCGNPFDPACGVE